MVASFLSDFTQIEVQGELGNGKYFNLLRKIPRTARAPLLYQARQQLPLIGSRRTAPYWPGQGRQLWSEPDPYGAA